MDPILILFIPMTLTLILASVLVAKGIASEIKTESLPLAERKSLRLNGRTFTLTSLDQEEFRERAAIYAILGAGQGPSFEIIDAGDTREMGSKPINAPERRASWLRRNPNILVGVNLLSSDDDTPQERSLIIRELLNEANRNESVN